MAQSNLLKNITGTAYLLGMALSAMSINSTMVVDGASFTMSSTAIYSNDDTYYSNSTAPESNNVYEKKTVIKLESEAYAMFGEMRNATQEEREMVNKYIDSISVNTGVNFFDIC